MVGSSTVALLLALFAQFFFTPSFAQGNLGSDVHGVVMEHLSNSDAAKGFRPELRITNAYVDKTMGLTQVYAQQQHNGVPVYNVISVFSLKEGKVVYAKESLVRDIAAIANAHVSGITPQQAINAAVGHLEKPLPQQIEELPAGKKAADRLRFNIPELCASPVEVRLVYLPSEGAVKLAWDVSMEMKGEAHWWNIRVDAHTGEYLEKNDYTVECNFDHVGHATHAGACSPASHTVGVRAAAPAPLPPASGPSYRAFQFPIEAPSFGARSLISDAADATASPFGWHDTNGAVGAEYTITRGNNAFAYEDANADNAPGYSPDGGSSLHFDFALDLNSTPQDNTDAALTNLFYATNAVHDILYLHGFDEAAGNFQNNNYGNAGFGSDEVLAEGFDGAGINNANFNTPPDGYDPRMQMFLWEVASPECNALNITSGLFTGAMTTGRAEFTGFGNVTADLILVQDAVAPATDGCTSFSNNVSGKIVLIDRGSCTFITKAQQAVAAGAVGVIIANNTAGVNNMTGTPVQSIPVVSVSQADGNQLKAALLDGPVTANIVTCAATLFDSNFDNGIIAHEYGHGLSNRLTGGPSVTGCLANAEQAGEGWSDWLALMLTMQLGDAGADARGVGTYVRNEASSGAGIRRYPYSTDMGINPLTYADMPTSDGVHARGEIWCATIWDLSWLLMDEFGFSSDPTVTTAGNNIAMQLVLGGLKLQPCSPGYIDGRDAILAADELLYGGAHRCKIWEAFARRGMGLSASQGSSAATNDQTVAYDLPTYCLPCADTPGATTAAASPEVFCGAGSVSLSLTGLVEAEGLTYQWYSSSDNSAFDLIDGATGKTHLATPGADTYYRCMVTCSHSAESTTSGSVAVTYVPGTNGGTASGPSEGQVGEELTYGVTGHSGSVQWQSATSASGPFNDILSATGTPYAYTPVAAGTVYFRAKVTGDGCDAFSNVVTTVVTVMGDNVCNAIQLTIGVLSDSYSNVGATIEVNEPLPPLSATCDGSDLSEWCSYPSHSLWFKFVPASGSLTISFSPADWDSQLALWRAETCDDMLTPDRLFLVANEDLVAEPPYNAQLNVPCLYPGLTYYLQVDGYDGIVSNNIRVLLTDNGDATTWYADSDGDSFGNPSVSIELCGQLDGYVANADDCDDNNVAVGSDCLQWTGAIDTDWENDANWDPEQMPTASDNVVIRSAPFNQPEVNAWPGTPAVCNHLTIDAGALVTVRPGKALTISGTLNNNGSLTVDAEQDGIGSLITQGNIIGSGDFVTRQYLKGAGGATPNGVFHYVSSPVAGATASAYNIASGNKLWSANEPGQNYPQISNGAAGLNVGQGYVVRMGGTGTVDLSGNGFHTGDVGLNNLTRTGAGENAGYNLIGNPYPSTVSWNNAIKVNMEPSIWYRTHTAGDLMTFDVYNVTLGSGTGNNRFGENADGLVPPGQGFWVRVLEGEVTGSVMFNNTMRSHGEQSQLYRLSEEVGEVRMRLIAPNGSDEVIIHFTADAQDGLDAFDSRKMWGAAALAQVYTTVAADTLTINGLFSTETNPVVDLGMKLPTAGDYSLNAHSITFTEDVWLEDRLLGSFQLLNENPVYDFSTVTSGNIPNRFALHFGMTAVGIDTDAACNVCTHVFAADGMVNVSVGTDNTTGTINILDMAGRTVQTATINGNRTVIPTHLTTGVYLVRVETEKGAETHRVMLR
jgi:hypothetical protein